MRACVCVCIAILWSSLHRGRVWGHYRVNGHVCVHSYFVVQFTGGGGVTE